MNDTKPIRSFLALELPPHIRSLIERLKEKLRSDVGAIRWTGGAGMHLTLKFFGDIVPDAVECISETVERHARSAPPLELALGSPGGFPDLMRPRVLWLGVCGDTDRLATLQAVIDKDLEKECGFPRDKRTFTAHLTLGRARSRAGVISGTDNLRERVGDLSAHRFTAGEVSLFKSDLTSSGPVYTKLASFFLEGDRAGS
jgi:2'-5' RNA ligase